MPARVRIPQRIVQRVRVAVEGLRRGRVGDDRIRLGEAPEQRVVPAGAVEIEPQRDLVILPGEALGCQGAERAVPVVSEGMIVPLPTRLNFVFYVYDEIMKLGYSGYSGGILAHSARLRPS